MFVSNTCVLLIRSDQRVDVIDVHYVMHVEMHVGQQLGSKVPL